MSAAWHVLAPAELTAREPRCAAQCCLAKVHADPGLDGTVEAADADTTRAEDSVSEDIVDLDVVGSPRVETPCRASGLRRQQLDAIRDLDRDVRSGANPIEVARKRAALVAEVAYHHFRLLSALKVAGEHARRTGNIQAFDDLEDQRITVAAFSASVSAAADNAHAEWMGLRTMSAQAAHERWAKRDNAAI